MLYGRILEEEKMQIILKYFLKKQKKKKVLNIYKGPWLQMVLRDFTKILTLKLK